MALFGGPKKLSYLGVDIGAGGMKLVELANEKGRARLLTYAYSERAAGEPGKPLIENSKAAADLLMKMIKQSGATSTQAISGLPQHAVFDAVISVPRVKDPKEQKLLIEAQVRKLTPIPFEEMIIDSKLLDEPKKEEKDQAKKTEAKKVLGAMQEAKERETVRVLVTGAAKTLVQKYVEIFKLAKVELVSLETESFALIRSLIGRDRAIIMMIDFGAVRSNITIVEKGIPYLTRSVNIGGNMVTQQIAEQMGISPTEAEQMKLDLAKSTSADVPPVVEAVLQPILNEINYSIGEFRRQTESQTAVLEKIIVTGGSAQLPGITAYLSSKLNVNVYLGDPWARVSVPQALRPVLDEIGPRVSVAVGLAMRDIE